MTYEESMLKEYAPLILQRVLIFGKKTGLPTHYRDDFYQEGCIAFVAFLRAKNITEGRLQNEEVKDVCRFIDLHFLTAFQDTDGLGLNRNTRKKFYANGGRGLDSSERLGLELNIERSSLDLPEDEFFSVYVHDWMNSLSEKERKTADELMSGYSMLEAAKRLKMSRQTLRTNVKRMRKSFREYVEGCLGYAS